LIFGRLEYSKADQAFDLLNLLCEVSLQPHTQAILKVLLVNSGVQSIKNAKEIVVERCFFKMRNYNVKEKMVGTATHIN
jgi:hypothetical protein